ncbi:YbaN family protein [Celeribacter sp.]|uniref:YbaN family protein n=1 Tax=Celeribacter sp. TaxID=1890673 RepID=UPI003A8F8FF4
MQSGSTNRLLRVFWFLLGATALILGTVGAVLPLLPTTPFIILAAFAFGKSVPALKTRLEKNRLFGPLITDWRTSGSIAPRYKMLAVAMMTATLMFGLTSSLPVAVKLVQLAIIAAAAFFVLSRPSFPKSTPLSSGRTG